MPFKGCCCVFVVLAFSCGRAKTIRIRYVWTRIFSKTVEEVSVVKNIRIRVDKAAFEWEPIGPIGFRHKVESLNYTLDQQISLNEIRAN